MSCHTLKHSSAFVCRVSPGRVVEYLLCVENESAWTSPEDRRSVQRTFCASACARGEQHGAFSLSPQGFLEEVLARGPFTSSWADRGTPGPCSTCMDADREGRGAGQQKGIGVVGSAVLGDNPKAFMPSGETGHASEFPQPTPTLCPRLAHQEGGADCGRIMGF